MVLEVYNAAAPSVVSETLLAELERGWLAVAQQLKEIGVGEMAELTRLEITLLDDSEIGRVHGDFLNDSSPTDVITFAHGELLIGVEVAVRQAGDFESSVEREIALYGIHGMLHLAGFDDRTTADAKEMETRQFELLAKFFPVFNSIITG